MSVSQRTWMAAALLMAVPAAAEEPPDMELLEYLGSWEETDEDWVLLTEEPEDAAPDTDDTRRDPVADAEDSQENDHES